MIRRIPFFKIVSVVQVALLAHRHLSALTPAERRLLAVLARHAHHLPQHERQEFVNLALKLEPRAFAGRAADHLSPFPLPKRIVSGRGSRVPKKPWR